MIVTTDTAADSRCSAGAGEEGEEAMTWPEAVTLVAFFAMIAFCIWITHE